MKPRLLGLGLLAASFQLFAAGCCWHPIERFRANHPCLSCRPVAHPLLHPIQTRRAILSGEAGYPVAGPVVGHPVEPVVTGPVVPPCHGCGGGVPAVPVGLHGAIPLEGTPIAPVGGYPPIGNPIPLGNGPTVVPQHELHSPMPLPKK